MNEKAGKRKWASAVSWRWWYGWWLSQPAGTRLWARRATSLSGPHGGPRQSWDPHPQFLQILKCLEPWAVESCLPRGWVRLSQPDRTPKGLPVLGSGGQSHSNSASSVNPSQAPFEGRERGGVEGRRGEGLGEEKL